MDKCMKEKMADKEAIAALVWHQCHWKCGKKSVSTTMPAVQAPTETCDQPKCYDKCHCEQIAKGETVEAVIWHICTWQCQKEEKKVEIVEAAAPNDQKCWDDCETEAKKTETNPSVIYQICFFKCGPKPSFQ
jgi:hypothetical protein